MRKIVKGLAIGVFFLCFHANAAENWFSVGRKQPTKLKKPGDLGAIFARGYFRVGMVANLPPFVRIPPKGEPSGLDIDLIKSMARIMGVKARIQVVRHPAQLSSWVKSGRVDFSASNIPMTVDSTQKVYFARPYLVANYAMLVNRYQAEKLALDSQLVSYDKKTCRLGYVVASFNVATLQFPFEKATKIKFSTYQEAVAALESRQIDALFGDSVTLRYYYDKNPLNAFSVRLIILPGFYMFSGIAQRFSSLMLGDWLKVFMENLYADKSSFLSRAKERYHLIGNLGGRDDKEA